MLGLLGVGTGSVVMVQDPVSMQVEVLMLLTTARVVGAVVVAKVLDTGLE